MNSSPFGKRKWQSLFLVALMVHTRSAKAQQEQCHASKLPKPEQSVYRVGVHGFRGNEVTYGFWNQTFSEYLTLTAGRNFDPPIRFEMLSAEIKRIYKDLTPGTVDFVFTQPSHFACIDSEIGAHSLVTLVNRRKLNGQTFDLTQFGGVIFSKAENAEINTLEDIKGKIVGAASITGLGSGQMQFRELERVGIHPLQDPKQLMFSENQGKVVNGVLNGQFDVGFVRTDQLERSIDARTGEPLNLSEVKIIGARNKLRTDGELFPFPITTTLYPEWNVASFSHVSTSVMKEVQASLYHLSDHAAIAPHLQSCYELSGCFDYNNTAGRQDCFDACFTSIDPSLFKRCDTTAEVALSAAQAMTNGKYAGWIPTLSYMELRSMQEELRIINVTENGAQCIRTAEFADAVVCPSGYYKATNEEILSGCEQAGLDCYGYHCVCSPCIEIPEEEKPTSNPYILAVCITLPIAFVVAVLVCFIEKKRREADLVWKIPEDALIFQDPPRVIGRGSFGVILLADYRGTNVAVKRSLPRKTRSKGTKLPLSPFDFQENPVPESAAPKGKNAGADLEVGLSKRMYTANSAMFSSVQRFGSMTSNLIDLAQLQRDFVKEMRLISKLRHPCITTILGAVIPKETEPMLVMEYMELGSLHDLLHNESFAVEHDIAVTILRDIAQGMRFLHSITPQIVHRDLKSHNVLVDSKFRAKVADFGLSQKNVLQRHAKGTPYWMAPELLRHESLNTTASDVYSFGIIMYEVFSRKDPYDGEDQKEVLRLVADQKVKKRPPVPESCPKEFSELMTACLRDVADQRPTAEDIDVRIKMLDTNNGSSNEKNAFPSHLFPEHVAEALREGIKIEPESHDDITVFFLYIVDFSSLSIQLDPAKLSDLLDRFFTKLDNLCEKHQVFKVETVSDAYMAVSNVATPQEDHIVVMANFAVEALDVACETLVDEENPDMGHVQARVGFSSGPAVSHVVGTKNPRFSIMGDTVTTAARMESSSEAGRIHCTEQCAHVLKEKCPNLEVTIRDEVNGAKTMNLATTYWVRPLQSAEERKRIQLKKEYIQARLQDVMSRSKH